jgi:DNA uptake protein ComE-like DNA-binding protein
MLASKYLSASCLAMTFALAACTACTSKPNPDEVRRQTADATATLKANAKAVAEGLKDGLTRPSTDRPLDLNAASKAQLKTLPGITDDAADRIMANRPYKNQHELLEKRVISREEYNRIADAITVKP